MAEKITVYQCPACTGPLKFDGTIGKLKCEYCGSTYTTQEIEALYKDKNESAAAADAEAQAKADKAEQAARKEAAESGDAGAASGWGSDAAHMRAYNCTTCGAELLCDETTAATSCPYCGNPTVIPGKFAGVDRPDYVIPFKVDKKQAVNSFKEYYKGRLLLPRSFASDNHIEEIKGVYVPFWMFSGEIDGRAQYEAYKEDKRRVGDEEITRREHYDVFREGSMKFSKIPVDASTKMPDDLMDSIEPFDYKEMRPFGMEYMPGYMANKYDVSKEQSRKRADERAVSSFRTALRNSVKNYNGVDVRQQSEKINPEKAEYGMLPVWLLSSNWQGQTYPLCHCRSSLRGSLRDHAFPDPQAAGRQHADQRGSSLHRCSHHRRGDERQHEASGQEHLRRRLCRAGRGPSASPPRRPLHQNDRNQTQN